MGKNVGQKLIGSHLVEGRMEAGRSPVSPQRLQPW